VNASEGATWLTWVYAGLVLAGLATFGVMGIIAALSNGEPTRWRR